MSQEPDSYLGAHKVNPFTNTSTYTSLPPRAPLPPQRSTLNSSTYAQRNSRAASQTSGPRRVTTITDWCELHGHNNTNATANDYYTGMIVKSVWTEPCLDSKLLESNPAVVYSRKGGWLCVKWRPYIVVEVYENGLVVVPIFSGQNGGIVKLPRKDRVDCVLLRNEGGSGSRFMTEAYGELFEEDRIVYVERPTIPSHCFEARPDSWLHVMQSRTIFFEYAIDVVGSLNEESTDVLLDFKNKLGARYVKRRPKSSVTDLTANGIAAATPASTVPGDSITSGSTACNHSNVELTAHSSSDMAPPTQGSAALLADKALNRPHPLPPKPPKTLTSNNMPTIISRVYRRHDKENMKGTDFTISRNLDSLHVESVVGGRDRSGRERSRSPARRKDHSSPRLSRFRDDETARQGQIRRRDNYRPGARDLRR